MEIYPYQMFVSALWVFVCGAAMGVIYDILRFTRALLGYRYRTLKDGSEENINKAVCEKKLFRAVLIVEDAFFVLSFGAVFAVALFYANDGAFRLLFLASMLLGFYSYYFSIGKLVIRILDILAAFVRGVISRVVRPVRLLLSKIARGIKKSAKKILHFFPQILEKSKIKGYNKKEGSIKEEENVNVG